MATFSVWGLSMQRDIVLQVLSNHLGEIRQKFGVESMALFVAVARGQSEPESDLDILVAFDKAAGLFGFLELKELS